MRPKQPAGGDVPPEFFNQGRFEEKPSEKLRKTNVDLARHNLEVTLKRTMEGCFRAAKAIALEGNEEKVREMDTFVRKAYAADSRKMAEWEELMSRYEFMNETLD